jgi:cysteine synthase
MVNPEKVLENTIQRCRERDIIIPTYREMADPSLVPAWKNEPIASGGGFGDVNFVELPSELTGVDARIFMLLGKYFPTGAHKVGATFGPLVEKLVRGAFDPTTQKALWPSTGNYCRGGAYDAHLLACPSIAVLPEGMSRERFEWLEKVGSEIYATPGSESNVKEIYDKTKELKAERPEEVVVLNQFAEFGNAIWHTQGSAGTLGCAEYLREVYPRTKVVAAEALQCPTLLLGGYGSHRIEGIGDKHVPWIHNIKTTDVVVGIDDQACMSLLRLFNEPEGRVHLKSRGVDPGIVDGLDLLGISGVANLLTAVKTARFFEMGPKDMLFTVATDSMELYGSRLEEERELHGAYTETAAAAHFERYLPGTGIDHMLELGYWDRKRIHNLKYFTWVEQQGKSVEELDAQWYDDDYWTIHFHAWEEWDRQIEAFNERTGILERYR